MLRLKLKKSKYKGKLIVFEGTDGAGKTTLVSLTEKLLKEKYGHDMVVCLKQPTDLSRKTKLFQKMMYSENHSDIDYRAVQLLTMSDRIQHGFEVIEPALRAGKIVICDRYVYTSLVNMVAREYKKEKWFYEISKHIINPDVKFLAYVDPKLAIKRIRERPEEANKYLNEDLLNRVSALFKKSAYKNNFVILDTANEPDYVFVEVANKLMKEKII